MLPAVGRRRVALMEMLRAGQVRIEETDEGEMGGTGEGVLEWRKRLLGG